MLFSTRVEAFIRVAEAGSFSKAAKQQYVTTATMMNHINALESELQLQLFDRTNKGICLTSAGQFLYQECSHLMRSSRAAVEAAQNIQKRQKRILHMGTFLANKTQRSEKFWELMQPLLSDIEIHMEVVNIQPGFGKTAFANIGHGIDVLFGIYSETILQRFQLQALLLQEMPLMCAVPLNHPLAGKTHLEEADFCGYRLMLHEEGSFPKTDALRAHIRECLPEVQIVDFDVFDTEIFNTYLSEQNLLMTIEPWKNIHPQLKTLPVNGPFTLDYGLMYRVDSGSAVTEFVRAAEQVLKML